MSCQKNVEMDLTTEKYILDYPIVSVKEQMKINFILLTQHIYTLCLTSFGLCWQGEYLFVFNYTVM